MYTSKLPVSNSNDFHRTSSNRNNDVMAAETSNETVELKENQLRKVELENKVETVTDGRSQQYDKISPVYTAVALHNLNCCFCILIYAFVGKQRLKSPAKTSVANN